MTEHILHITRVATNLPSSTSNYLSHACILQHLKEARKLLKQRQRNHIELREEYLEGLAEALLLQRDPHLTSNEKLFRKQKAKQILELKKRELQ